VTAAREYGKGGTLPSGITVVTNTTGEYELPAHPPHYNSHPAGIECIDVIEHMTFNVGSAIKYAWRAGLKPGTEAITDYEKARWYLDREIIRLRKMRDEP
jgi:hypothetical protein